MIGADQYKKYQSGFTLVELMVALVVAIVITGAAYASYVVQQQSFTAQDQVVEIQQNIRVGLNMMAREMRMAGFDPQLTENYGILEKITVGATTYKTDKDNFIFTADMCQDGGDPTAPTCATPPETYIYQLYKPGYAGPDYPFALRRTLNGSAIAENIEFLEFYYTLEDGTQTLNPTITELDQIVTVEVTVIARADQQDFKFINNRPFPQTPGGTVIPAANDNYRRRMLTTTIQLRNMGL